MAVDTEKKRWGMMAFGGGVHTHAVINPTGSDMDAAERASLLGLYGGIALDAPVAPGGPASRLMLMGMG